MYAFLKALIAGAVLSFVVSTVIGHTGSTGGVANVHHFVVHGFGFYWSWVLFLAAGGLAFVIFLMME